MQNKINIEVYIPMIDKKYELFIPINKTIKQVLNLVNNGVKDITDGRYINFENSVLMDQKTSSIYPNNILVKDSGLINGSKVIIV